MRLASLTTAYAYNTRAKNPRRDPSPSDWDPSINHLLWRDYQFLALRFGPEGYLFRGMSCGLSEALASNRFSFFPDPSPLCALERELGVYLVSHEFPDAFSVARLWEGSHDAGVLVLKASVFHDFWLEKRAAVLGFAEPGVVFKYPLFAAPVALDQVSFVVVHPETKRWFVGVLENNTVEPRLRESLAAFYRRLIAPESPAMALDRGSFEKAVTHLLAATGVASAIPVSTKCYPRRPAR